MTITGGCLCRAVRYTVSTDAIATRVCWCRVCQYLAAGSATVNLVFPGAAVTVTGPLRDYSSIADSGNRMRRQFCEHCGTPVTSISEARPHLTIRSQTRAVILGREPVMLASKLNHRQAEPDDDARFGQQRVVHVFRP